MRIFKPFMSPMVLISLRNQPPICAPVLPAGKLMMLYSFMNSRIKSNPPPWYIHAFCCRAFMPKGIAQAKAKVGSLPKK